MWPQLDPGDREVAVTVVQFDGSPAVLPEAGELRAREARVELAQQEYLDPRQTRAELGVAVEEKREDIHRPGGNPVVEVSCVVERGQDAMIDVDACEGHVGPEHEPDAVEAPARVAEFRPQFVT